MEYLPEDLQNALITVQDFYTNNHDLLGPLKDLVYWLECTEKDITAEPRPNNNEA